MKKPDFETFKAAALARGCDEVVERSWDAGVVTEQHSHPFVVDALVVQGEMWLIEPEQTRHLVPGDTFHLDHDMPHAEQYGDEGATYWAARRTTHHDDATRPAP